MQPEPPLSQIFERLMIEMLTRTRSALIALWAVIAAGCGVPDADSSSSASAAPQLVAPARDGSGPNIKADLATAPAPVTAGATELAARCAGAIRRVADIQLNVASCQPDVPQPSGPGRNRSGYKQCGTAVVPDFAFCGLSRPRAGETGGAPCAVIKTGTTLSVIGLPGQPSGAGLVQTVSAKLDRSTADVRGFDNDQGRVEFLSVSDASAGPQGGRSAIKVTIIAGEVRGLDYAVEIDAGGKAIKNLNCALPTAR